jgi:glycosyltransferase involved in cell wall biosynthesis
MVSINCITYNHKEYIENAIESFLMQKTDFDYEILIHDDASTDGTSEIVLEYQKKYPKTIKPLIQKENQYSKNINCRIVSFNHDRAKGKYIAICEGDDYWMDPYKLQKQVDYMEANPKCTLHTHSVKIIRAQDDKPMGLISPYKNSTICKTEDVISGGGGFFGTCASLFPKKAFDNNPEWYLDSPVCDYPIQMLLAMRGYVYYSDEVMAAYRLNSQGSWTQKLFSEKSNYNEFHKKMITMLENFNEYSKFKYDGVVKKTIKKYMFDMLMVNDLYNELRSEDYRELYLSLSLLIRVKMFIKQRFGFFAKIIIGLKRKLQK